MSERSHLLKGITPFLKNKVEHEFNKYYELYCKLPVRDHWHMTSERFLE